MRTVFAVGGNLVIPNALPLPPQEWRASYDEMARESNLEYAFDDVGYASCLGQKGHPTDRKGLGAGFP
jgi:hypothetical protein